MIDIGRSIMGVDLPTIKRIYMNHSLRKAANVIKDSHHTAHTLLLLHLLGKNYKSLRTVISTTASSHQPLGSDLVWLCFYSPCTLACAIMIRLPGITLLLIIVKKKNCYVIGFVKLPQVRFSLFLSWCI